MSSLRSLALCLGLFVTPIQANGLLDWVPTEETLEPMCGYSLVDLLGAASVATTTASIVGLSSTTVTATPFVAAMIAGESSLVIVTGSSISVVTTPVVGTGVAIVSAVASTAYVGGKGLCALSSALSSTHITNEPIPLVMLVNESSIFTNTHDALLNGQARFVETEEVIPVGTPVLSLGPVSELEASSYPDYQGRGLIKLGQFFDHVYESEIPVEELGFAVVPANSLNTIFKENYTHIFTEDTLVERRGDETMVPSGTTFELLKLREDGWAKIQLGDGWNLWVEDLSTAIDINPSVFEVVNSVGD
jgi:hypothetical protein